MRAELLAFHTVSPDSNASRRGRRVAEMAKRRKAESESPTRTLFPAVQDSVPESAATPPDIAPLKPTAAYDTYWRFAVERQRSFFRRLERCPPPWTEDPILLGNKFTNAYCASDRVSQYLIRRVIYRDDLPADPAEVVFRTLMFKVFNKIETWELLEKDVGPVTHEGYSFNRYDQVLTKAMERGESIYSAAYIMPSAGSLGHQKKHQNHLVLIERMMAAELPARLADAGSMQKAFNLILAYPSIGDFLAYQYVTDINYSTVTDYTEMEFVTAGPGAVDGITKCFADTAGRSNADVIRFMAERQEIEFARLGLKFQTLWGRRLQLIDCQNLFCEVSKYARVKHPEIKGVSGRIQIKQKFRAHPDPIPFMYPPKWGINGSGRPFGNELDDNSDRRDGNAYHDALHLSFAAILGWSPLTRKLLEVKRRDGNRYDGVERVEDGGRAIATEEGLSAMIFAYARDYNFLEGKNSVSTELLRMVKNMTDHLEVSVCTASEWEKAIVEGLKVWRLIKKQRAGALIVNLDERNVKLKE